MKPIVLGITGGIASGKTTVMRLLARRGIPTISSDELSHAAIRRGKPAHRAIVKKFGKGILDSTHEIQRGKLGEIVFSKPSARRVLESIIHPYVIRDLQAFVKRHRGKTIALDIPLLFEHHLSRLVDKAWVVYSSPAQQITRLRRRSGLSRKQALLRIKAQMPLARKRKMADRVVLNTGNRSALARAVKKALDDLRGKNA